MDVSIDFESVEPPAGRACRVANGAWLQFAGWLDLIGALERLLEPTTPRPESDQAACRR